MVENTGLHIWMLELLYDKYCAPFDISRVMLFDTLVWLKHIYALCYGDANSTPLGLCKATYNWFSVFNFHRIVFLDIPRSTLR